MKQILKFSFMVVCFAIPLSVKEMVHAEDLPVDPVISGQIIYDPIPIAKATSDHTNHRKLTEKSTYLDIELPYIKYKPPIQIPGDRYKRIPKGIGIKAIKNGIPISATTLIAGAAKVDIDRAHFSTVIKAGVYRVNINEPLKLGDLIGLRYVFIYAYTAGFSARPFDNIYDMQYVFPVLLEPLVLHPKIESEATMGKLKGTGQIAGDDIEIEINGKKKKTKVQSNKKWSIDWGARIPNKAMMIVKESNSKGDYGTSYVFASSTPKPLRVNMQSDVTMGSITGTGEIVGDKIEVEIAGVKKTANVQSNKSWTINWGSRIPNNIKMTVKETNSKDDYAYVESATVTTNTISKPKNLNLTVEKDVSRGTVSGTGGITGDKIEVEIEGIKETTSVKTDKSWSIIWKKKIPNDVKITVKETNSKDDYAYIESATVTVNSVVHLIPELKFGKIEAVNFPSKSLTANSSGYVDVFPSASNWGLEVYDSRNEGAGAKWQVMAKLSENKLISKKNNKHVLKDILKCKQLDGEISSLTNDSKVIFTNDVKMSENKNATISIASDYNQTVKYKDNTGLYLHVLMSDVYAEDYSGTLDLTLAGVPGE